MLELRPSCEHCDRDLPPESPSARICTYECTFCADCADLLLGGRCPNCGGELVRRPVRPADRLAAHPPRADRVHHPLDDAARRAHLDGRGSGGTPTAEPRPGRLHLYGSPADVEPLPWAWVDRTMREAGTYWLQGGPGPAHPRPVWGLWHDGVLHLSVGSPHLLAVVGDDAGPCPVVVHLDSGTDVVIVEGHATIPTGTAQELVDSYIAKYDHPYEVAELGPLTRVRPHTILAWRSHGWAGREGFRHGGRWSLEDRGS